MWLKSVCYSSKPSTAKLHTHTHTHTQYCHAKWILTYGRNLYWNQRSHCSGSNRVLRLRNNSYRRRVDASNLLACCKPLFPVFFVIPSSSDCDGFLLGLSLHAHAYAHMQQEDLSPVIGKKWRNSPGILVAMSDRSCSNWNNSPESSSSCSARQRRLGSRKHHRLCSVECARLMAFHGLCSKKALENC